MDIKLKLREALLSEIFDDKGLPYTVLDQRVSSNSAYLEYEFIVPNKDGDYTILVDCYSTPRPDNTTLKHICDDLNIEIYENGIYLSVNFKLKVDKDSEGQAYETINRGDVLKIVSTVKTIVLNSIKYLEKQGLKLMMVYSLPVANIGKTAQSTDTREKMYNYLYNKMKKPSFSLFKFNSYSGMYNTKKIRKPKPAKRLEQTNPTVKTEIEVIERINKYLTSIEGGVFLQPKLTNETDAMVFPFTDFDNYPSKYYFYFNYNIRYVGTEEIVTQTISPKDQRTLDFVLQHIDEFNNVIR
jgi:CRISPR/Cas system-associated protein endoribonuclease Cas2